MRKAKLGLLIGVVLIFLMSGQVGAETLIYSYTGGAWTFIDGEGVMSISGVISTPSRVMYGTITPSYVVEGAIITIDFASVNCTSWGIFIHDTETREYRVFDSNRTTTSENYRLSGDVVADGIALEIISGSAQLANLTIYAAEPSPGALLDWLIYNLVPPWVIQVGALICILIFIILLIAPRKEKTKVGMYG